MKVLVITNLFPNRTAQHVAMFNKQQIVELANHCDLKVIAPIAYFPLIKSLKESHSWRDVPARDVIDGIEVFYPRYLVTPKIGRALYGFTFLSPVKKLVKEITKGFNFDVIYGTWAYPDGFASALIAKSLDKPLVLKVHGTDINELAKSYLRGKLIKFALKEAKTVLAVSDALKQAVIGLGIPEEKVYLLPNGLDTDKFSPMPKLQQRGRVNLPKDNQVILFIGNLKPVKGLTYLLGAFNAIRKNNGNNIRLVLVGDGKQRQELEAKVASFGMEKDVSFMGMRPHAEVPLWLNASDVLCLPSLHEGMPNVVLEALACGIPVVATNVGGIPEIIEENANGFLVPPQDSKILAEKLKLALSKSWNTPKLRGCVEHLSWQVNGERLYRILFENAR